MHLLNKNNNSNKFEVFSVKLLASICTCKSLRKNIFLNILLYFNIIGNVCKMSSILWLVRHKLRFDEIMNMLI